MRQNGHLVVFACVLAACGDNYRPYFDAHVVDDSLLADASDDAMRDSGDPPVGDAPGDAPTDATGDAPGDAPLDAPGDAPTDAPGDAPMLDAGLDAPMLDAPGIDAPIDAPLDPVAIVVSPTSGLVTTEAGGTATFTVVLTAQPTANVTIALASNDATEGTAAPPSLVFTPGNWNQPRTITVTGVNDNLDDGNVGYAIVLAPATSSDGRYAGLDPDDVAVTNLDNDTARVIVTPTSGLVTTEAGADDSFTVVLATQPSAPVTIAVSSSDTTEGTVAPTSLVFTPANWNIARAVVVTGVNDAIADGNVVYRAVLAPATSADATYNGIDPADVTVTNLDNDAAGIVVVPTTGLQVTELGTTDTFEISLATQPTAAVTIGLSSSDTTEGTVAPASVTFTPANWNQPRTVTVTGVNDAALDGDQVFTIITAPATSTDARYNNLNAADVEVTNIDDEKAQVIVLAPRLLRVSENGRIARFRMLLSVQPLSAVTCTISSTDTSEGQVSPATLVFTPANFAQPQLVTVLGVDDNLDDGDQLFTIVNAACTSADSRYDGADPRDLPARNRDND